MNLDSLAPALTSLLLCSLLSGATVAVAMTPDEITLVARAAERGSASAEVLLAVAYLDGDGVNKDAVAAVRWFEAAALQGNGYAEEKLGDLYAQGLGVERNESVAADWREKAANRLACSSGTRCSSGGRPDSWRPR